MWAKYVWILALLAALSSTKPLKQSKIIKAINCGLREGSTRTDDIKYENVHIDKSHRMLILSPGSQLMLTITPTPQQAMLKSSINWKTWRRFAMDKEIFMFERHTYSEMTYKLPVKTGAHTLILKFAEVSFWSYHRCISKVQARGSSISKLATQS